MTSLQAGQAIFLRSYARLPLYPDEKMEKTRPRSASVTARPTGIPCHLARHIRQQVAVACWAVNTGCPRIGVYLPSFAISAGNRRFDSRFRAWCMTLSIHFSVTYARSFSFSLKRLRNFDWASRSKQSVVVRSCSTCRLRPPETYLISRITLSSR